MSLVVAIVLLLVLLLLASHLKPFRSRYPVLPSVRTEKKTRGRFLAPQATSKRKDTRAAPAGLSQSTPFSVHTSGLQVATLMRGSRSEMFAIDYCFLFCTGKMFRMERLLVEQGGANTRARAKLLHEPLHVACLGNWGEVVNFLLTEGHVDVEAPDKNGMRCLHLAVQKNRLEAIRELLKHGCECFRNPCFP